MKRRVVVAFVFLVARLSAAQVPGTRSPEVASTSNPSYSIFVQSLTNGTIYRKEPQSSSFEPFLTGLGEPVDVILGPGGALGTLYVLPHVNGSVRRYDPCTGEFLGNFGDAAAVHAHSLRFGPGGLLYILEAGGPVKLYDGQTGAAVLPSVVTGPFVNADDTEFGPGGSFFVADYGDSKLLRYDAAGSPFPAAGFPDTAVFAQGDPLDQPSPLEIDGSGRLYVGSWNNSDILRYNATTGGFLDVAADGDIVHPSDLRFAPDGTLYIMSEGNGRLFQLSDTGTLTDVTSNLPPGGHTVELGPDCRGVTQVPTLSGPAFMVFAALLAAGGALLLRRRRA